MMLPFASTILLLLIVQLHANTSQDNPIVALSRTDSEGRFRFENVRPGRYRVIPVATDVEGIELIAEVGASLKGEIVYVGTQPQKLDELFAKAFLRLINLSESSSLGMREMRLDRQGRFSASGLQAGEYTIMLETQGEPGWMILGAEARSTRTNGKFVIEPGEEIRDFRLLIGRSTGVIRGRLQVGGDTIPANAYIVVIAVLENQEELVTSVDDVDARGFFRLQGLMPGRYTLICDLMFHAPFPEGWTGNNRAVIATVDIAEGQVINLDLIKYTIRSK